MGKICRIHIKVDGLYQIGDGYVSEDAMEAFDTFWSTYTPKSETLQIGIRKKTQRTDFYLYSVYGCINIHPMLLEGILETSNCSDREKFQYQLGELERVMRDMTCFMAEYDLEVSYEITYSIADMPRELFYMQPFRSEVVAYETI